MGKDDIYKQRKKFYNKPSFIEIPIVCPKCGYSGIFKTMYGDQIKCPECLTQFSRGDVSGVRIPEIDISFGYSKKLDPYGKFSEDDDDCEEDEHWC